MKRSILFAIWAIVFIGIQIFVNCSNPLEGIDNKNLTPPGPTTDVDTLYSIDTVVVMDTLVNIDTVVVIGPGAGGSFIVCSKIVSNQQDITWMFRNQQGLFKLEFVALTERDQPTQILTVNIDGEEYLWCPAENPELIMDLYLKQHATIRIVANKPPSHGHTIDICLTVSPATP